MSHRGLTPAPCGSCFYSTLCRQIYALLRSHQQSSEHLLFGQRTTTIFAPNGSGKTPLIQAVAFCLGFPVTFRQDINDKCQAAVLTVEINSEQLSFRRHIGKDFHVEVRAANGSVRDFFSENDFSKAVFQSLNISLPILVSSSKQATNPYLATVLPLFYLDQDSGYAEYYKPIKSFISDQFVEMIRFCFGLGPKHSFQAKSDLIKAKERAIRVV